MGSRMPDLLFIPRMDETLHPFQPKIFEKSKNSTSQQVLENQHVFSWKKNKDQNDRVDEIYRFKTIPVSFFIEKSIKIEGDG